MSMSEKYLNNEVDKRRIRKGSHKNWYFVSQKFKNIFKGTERDEMSSRGTKQKKNISLILVVLVIFFSVIVSSNLDIRKVVTYG